MYKRPVLLGKRQRALVAVVIDRGGSVTVSEFKDMSIAWEKNKTLFVSLEGIIRRGFLACSDDIITVASRIYVTPEGRKVLIDKPLAIIRKSVEDYARSVFDDRTRRMMDDVEKRLAEGAKVCLVVEDITRRNKVRRAVSYKLGDKDLQVHVPNDSGIDWLRFTVPGRELFVEPALLERKFEKQLAYLDRYRSSGSTLAAREKE